MAYSAYSPRARRGYRDSYYPQEVWVADADGTNGRRVYTATHNVESTHIIFGFSPDGRYIAHLDYGRPFDYVVTSVDGSGSNPLRGGDEIEMKGFWGWSPNGRHLAYTTYRENDQGDQNKLSLWIADGDGSNPVMIAQSDMYSRLWDEPPFGWSPDGKHIAYTVTTWQPDNPESPPITYTETSAGYRVARTNGDISHEVWVAHTNSSSPMKIADGWFDSWSPDGRLLAYNAGIDYRHFDFFIVDDVAIRDAELWVVETDGSNPVLLTENGRSFTYHRVAWSML